MEDKNIFEGLNNEENSAEYTVTPEGGFYTKQKDEIIQDEVLVKPETAQEEKKAAEPVFDANFYSPTPKKKEKRRYGIGVVIASCVLALVIGAGSSLGMFLFLYKNTDNSTEKTHDFSEEIVNIKIDDTVESVVEAVAKKVTPMVVGIRTTTSVISFFGGTQEASGEGSGVIYREDGYIITNYHVISDAVESKATSKIEVFLEADATDGYAASVVGYNISSDLALIKIDVKGLPVIEFADSDKLNVGQYVITVGNPGGLEFMDSVTYGVISGLDRVVSSDSGVELIQTDAAINPGNSGGALLNTKGELVGINSSKIVAQEFEGMGFALPSNDVKEICEKIITKENSPEPYLGISISEKYTAKVLERYGFPNGAVVLSVATGSPAYEAGIRKGDIITECDGKDIKEYTVFEEIAEDLKPGKKIDIKFYRSGRYYTTTLEVGSNNAVE